MKFSTTQKLTLGTILAGAAQLFAAPITIYNTGIANGSGLDAHYTLTLMPASTGYGTDPYVITNASNIYPATSPATSWLANTTVGLTGSSWIGPVLTLNTSAGHTNAASGIYDYATTFDLSLFITSTVGLNGKWAADGAGTNIILNGHALGLTTVVPTPNSSAGSYTGFTPFAIDNNTCPGCFVKGMNTLTFEVRNGSAESGLRAEVFGNGTQVPEPSTWFAMGTGLGVLGVLRRRS